MPLSFVVTKVLIFCIEFLKLSHLTHDLSQAKKKITVTSWATDKMKTIFTQNENFDHFEWNICMSFCAFAQLVIPFIFFSAWDLSSVNEATPKIQYKKWGPYPTHWMGNNSKATHICCTNFPKSVVWSIIPNPFWIRWNPTRFSIYVSVIAVDALIPSLPLLYIICHINDYVTALCHVI